MSARARRRVLTRKTRPSPGRLRLKKHSRRKQAIIAIGLAGVLEPAHLTVHGLHRVHRTFEKIGRALDKPSFKKGPGTIQYVVGEAVQLEDLDLPDDVVAELEDEILGIMDGTGLTIMSEASEIVPVDTGNLKSSLWYEVDEASLSLSVGDNAGYATFVENGTIHMGPHPFLKLAMEGNRQEMEAEIDGAIATALDQQAQNEDVGIDPAVLTAMTEEELSIETEIVIESELVGIGAEFL